MLSVKNKTHEKRMRIFYCCQFLYILVSDYGKVVLLLLCKQTILCVVSHLRQQASYIFEDIN